MGIPLLSGRDFEPADHLDGAAITIVSASMAEEFWPGRDPLGLTIMDSIRVVGVVGDVKDARVTGDAPPIAYFPLRSAAWSSGLSFQMHHVVRTTGDPAELQQVVRSEVRRIAPEAPMFEVTTMDRIVAESIDTFTFAERMMTVAAGVALFLGAIGLYAVLAYSVRLRRGEIGLRMALGASAWDARQLVLRDGLALAALGIAIGLVGAFFATRVLSAMLFGVTPLDPAAYGASVILFLIVAILACLVPAAKAAGVPPSEVLRGE
jgi:ABC-type lipoprotein release transport system permease subunit